MVNPWKFVTRMVVQGLHPSVDNQECYLFRRGDGGERLTDVFSYCYMPVEKFWGVPPVPQFEAGTTGTASTERMTG